MSTEIRRVVSSIVRKDVRGERPLVNLDNVGSGTGALVDGPELSSAESGQNIAAEPGDVLFSKLRPYLRKSWLVREPVFASGEFLCLRPGAAVDARWLAYLTLSEPWIDHSQASSYGTKMPRTSWEEMATFRVRVARLADQRRVSDFLDDQVSRMDDAQRLRRQQSESLIARHLAFAREVTTTGSSPNRQATDVVWMPDIAAGWSLPKISSLFRTGSGTTPPSDDLSYYDGDIPWVNTGDIKDAHLSSVTKTVSRKALSDFSVLRLYPPGALIVAMYGQGATKGRVALLDIEACVNQACCVLTSGSPGVTEWAFYWFQAYKDQIVQLAVGSGQPNLNQDIVRSLKIPIPPDHERNRLIARLQERQRATEELVAVMNAQAALLEDRKRSLITAAVTGEFDVTTASGRGM